jgi:putative Ca2+/H+ antiporter (TMEM165/GDT1 family)
MPPSSTASSRPCGPTTSPLTASGTVPALPTRTGSGVTSIRNCSAGVYTLWEALKDEEELAKEETSKPGVVLTIFLVISAAKWGNLTQILTLNFRLTPPSQSEFSPSWPRGP